MATWGPTDAGSAAATTSSGLGAGLGPHLPVGTWSGTKYRSSMRWQPPPWAAWVGITSATLKLKVTDFAHVGPRNSTIFAKRMSTAAQWVGGSGTQNCNSGFSASNATQYGDITPVAANAVSFQSGTTENKWLSIDVTALVRDYFNAKATCDTISIILDGQDSTDYSEFYSDDSPGNEPTLTIVYSDVAPPTAPTLGSPASGAAVTTQTPTFTWTHNDPNSDAQSQAEVQLYDAGGVAIGPPQVVVGATNSLVWPNSLSPKTNYQWSVRTMDATAFGPFAAKRSFRVKGGPTVFVQPTSPDVSWFNGAPRMTVSFYTWSDDSLQDTPISEYQIENQSGGVIVPWKAAPAASTVIHHLLDTFPVSDNVVYPFRFRARTQGVTYDDGFVDTTQKVRFGVTTHHKVIVPTPTDWLSAVPTQVAPIPTGSSLKMQYGSHPTSSAAPLSWVDDIGSVPKNNPHFFWRAWFMPGDGNGPTLDKLVISSMGGAALDLDKWTTDTSFPAVAQPQKPHAFAAPWTVDQSEYVYGSRSVSVDVPGGTTVALWHEKSISLRANRSYILTGLMKSKGDPQAYFEVQDNTGTVIQAQGVGLPPGPMRSPIVPADSTFFTDKKDVHRYRTPVLTVGDTDIDVYVALVSAGGVAGSKAWWDALKLEESTVATPWSPGAIGASIVDAGGIQVDASKGGTFRLKGATGGTRDTVELGNRGLLFAGDTELNSPSLGILNVNGQPIGGASVELLRYVPIQVVNPVSITYTATTAQLHTPTITAIPPEAVAVAVQLMGNSSVVSPGDRYEVMDYGAAAGYRAQGFSGKVASHYEAMSSHYVVLGGDRQFDYKVTVGTAGNHLIIISVLGYWLKEMSSAIAVGGGGVIGAGAVFPASPVPDHRFYRTDIDMEFHWDGTQWLCNCPHYVPSAGGPRGALPTAASAAANYWTPLIPPAGCSDIWIEAVDYFYQVGNGAAWNASNFWTHAVIKFIEGGASAFIDQASPNGLSTNVPHAFRRQINALFGVPAGYVGWRVDYTKNGSPDVLYAGAALQVRYVAV